MDTDLVHALLMLPRFPLPMALVPEQMVSAEGVRELSDIIAAADRLGVADLVECAVTVAVSSLSEANVVALANFSQAGISGLGALEAATATYLQDHFEAMREREDLCVDLNMPAFQALVASPSLAVASEDALLDAVWRRLGASCPTADEVEALLRSIRLKLLSTASLTALSAIAQGHATEAVKNPYPAVREGATAAVLRNLSVLGDGGRDPGDALPASVCQRSQVAAVSSSVMVSLVETDTTKKSSVVTANAHTWKLEAFVQPAASEKAGALAAFLQPCETLASELTVSYCLWSLTIDGGHLIQPAELSQKSATNLEVRWQSCVSCSPRTRRGPDACIGGLLIPKPVTLADLTPT